MKHIRPLAREIAVETGFAGYRAQFASQLESAVIISSWIDNGGCGPSLHYHASDQVYVMTSGQMTVRLGDQVTTASAGDLVYIPAGLAHCNWNESGAPEHHYEFIVPTPRAGRPLAMLVDDPGSVPEEARTTTPGFVRSSAGLPAREPRPGFSFTELLGETDGPPRAYVYLAEMAPGAAGPSLHVHEFDQYYIVLEGELTVQIGFEQTTVEANTLIVLPAGVPHCQFNASSAVERHLAVNAPFPLSRPWDVPVTFHHAGEQP